MFSEADSFAESITESREYAFLPVCTDTPLLLDRLQPVCQMAPGLPLNHFGALLEDWGRSRRQPLANRTQTATIDYNLLDKQPLLSLARHLIALASMVDNLITTADTSLSAKITKCPIKRGMGDWARGSLQRLRLFEDESDQDQFSATAAAANQLHYGWGCGG